MDNHYVVIVGMANAIRVGEHLAGCLGVSLAPAVSKQAAGERVPPGVSR